MTEVTNRATPLAEQKRRSRLIDFFRRLVREKPLGTFGGIIVLLMLLVGIFADVLAPYGMNETHLIDRLSPASGKYLLGTDQLGRDILSRVIYGARVSVIIGLAGTSLCVAVAMLIGITGLRRQARPDPPEVGRRLDGLPAAAHSRHGDVAGWTRHASDHPGPGDQLGISNSRIARSAVIAIKESMYIQAAEAIGVGTGRTILRHVFPNIMAPLIVIFTVNVGAVIVTEAALSFLGFGLPPDAASWGGMLSWEGRRYMEMAPRIALWPGVTLSVVVWGTNMFGDALRDLLDPSLRGGVGRFERLKKKKVKKKN